MADKDINQQLVRHCDLYKEFQQQLCFHLDACSALLASEDEICPDSVRGMEIQTEVLCMSSDDLGLLGV